MVWTTLRALGLDFEKRPVDLLKGEQRKRNYLLINPRGKVPSIRDEGFSIAESRAISAYLCNKYEQGDDEVRLYPLQHRDRGVVDQLLYVSETISDMIQSYLNTSGVIFRGEVTKANKLPEVHKALGLVEHYLKRQKFVAADHLTLADFVEFSEYRNYPNIVNWLKRIKQLPYFEECNLEGLNALKLMYCSALQKNEAILGSASMKDAKVSKLSLKSEKSLGKHRNRDFPSGAEGTEEWQRSSQQDFRETQKNLDSRTSSGANGAGREWNAGGNSLDSEGKDQSDQNQDQTRSNRSNRKSIEENDNRGSPDSSFWNRPPAERSQQSLEQVLMSGALEADQVAAETPDDSLAINPGNNEEEEGALQC